MVAFGGEVKRGEDPHLAEKKKEFLPGVPHGGNTQGTHRNITQKIERPQRGILRAKYGQRFNDIFKMLVDTPFCLFLTLLYR